MTLTPRRRRAFRLVAVALVLFVALGVLEIGLRLFWTGYYRTEPGMRSVPSATLAWENRPSTSFRYGEAEYVMDVRHESHGFRGAEVPDAKPADRVRVVVLGDSFTWGMGVEEADTFCARIQAAEPRLEVVNAGVQGYGTRQELLLFREKCAPLRPDVVLLCFFWNDVANNVNGPALGLSLAPDGTIAYRPPGAPRRKAPAEEERAGAFLRRSYAYRYLRDKGRLLRLSILAAAGAEFEDPDRLRPEQIDDAWKLQRALFAALAKDASAAGAKFVLVLIPDQVQVHTDVHVTGLGGHYVDVQDRMHAAAKDLGIPLIDLTEGLREAAAKDPAPLYYRFDRHLNAAGHAAAARVMLEEMRRLRLW